MRGPHLHRRDANGGQQSWTLAAQIGAIALARLPDGCAGLLAVVNLPVRCVTSCAFGGADYGTLYITSGAVHTTESERDQQPLAGWLLAVRVGAQGIPEVEFKVGAHLR